jgi:hypothetical protein
LQLGYNGSKTSYSDLEVWTGGREARRSKSNRLDVRFGSLASFLALTGHVRSYPQSDRLLRRREMTLCAISDGVHRNKKKPASAGTARVRQKFGARLQLAIY